MNYEKEPLHISTSVPNGTYEVTVTVTAHEDIIFTILSQSRRFMAQDIKLGKGESVRGESLSLEEFAALSNDLWEKKGR